MADPIRNTQWICQETCHEYLIERTLRVPEFHQEPQVRHSLSTPRVVLLQTARFMDGHQNTRGG